MYSLPVRGDAAQSQSVHVDPYSRQNAEAHRIRYAEAVQAGHTHCPCLTTHIALLLVYERIRFRFRSRSSSHPGSLDPGHHYTGCLNLVQMGVHGVPSSRVVSAPTAVRHENRPHSGMLSDHYGRASDHACCCNRNRALGPAPSGPCVAAGPLFSQSRHVEPSRMGLIDLEACQAHL